MTFLTTSVPGVLPYQAYREFIDARYITSARTITPKQLQPASLDLRLGHKAWRIQASFMPGDCTVMQKIEKLKMHAIDLSEGAIFERGCTYVVKLDEALNLPDNVSGSANPKSSTGRLDIFTRLMTDHAKGFETIPAGYKGPLFLEVTPRTFSIRVQEGLSLNQIRLRRLVTSAPHNELQDLIDLSSEIVWDTTNARPPSRRGLQLSISLAGPPDSIIGYRAKHHTPLLDLAKINHYPISDFWEPMVRCADDTLILNPGEFYILMSREKIKISPDHAAEMVPFDTAVGEFRCHYAGFFDPGFGHRHDQVQGTPAVLEVRSHEVPFHLEHGQIVATLVFERLAARPAKLYGADLESNYQAQHLTLSKQFRR